MLPAGRTLRLSLLLLLAGAAADAAPAPKEEVVAIFEHRRVTLTLPDGFTVVRNEAANGVVSLKISRPKGVPDLQIDFFPDPNDELVGSARARKEMMVGVFQEFVAASVEQAMQFEELARDAVESLRLVCHRGYNPREDAR